MRAVSLYSFLGANIFLSFCFLLRTELIEHQALFHSLFILHLYLYLYLSFIFLLSFKRPSYLREARNCRRMKRGLIYFFLLFLCLAPASIHAAKVNWLSDGQTFTLEYSSSAFTIGDDNPSIRIGTDDHITFYGPISQFLGEIDAISPIAVHQEVNLLPSSIPNIPSVSTIQGNPSTNTTLSGNVFLRSEFAVENFFFINERATGPGTTTDIYVGNTTNVFRLFSEADVPWTIEQGGTWANNIESARNNLQLGSLAVEDFVTLDLLLEIIP